MISLDVSLYLVTDNHLTAGRDIFDIVEKACAAGVTLVQYRDKDNHRDEFVRRARRMVEICHRHGVACIINDRADTVAETGADGLHIGQDDMPLDEARRLVGKTAIIGVSVAAWEQAQRAQREGANYIAASGVFPTDTKKDLSGVFGLDGIRRFTKDITVPTVAIGGINAHNAPEVIAAGVDGVAVVTAITMAADIEAAVKALADAVARGKELRS